jgi:hypothetical protein
MTDDGSCKFTEQPSIGEHGIIDVTDNWQQILLHGTSYARPVVFCGVLTRQSTAQAVVQIQNVNIDSTGRWSFEVRAEQKSCHFAKPPPTMERVTYLVVETGISEEGWQAGMIRTTDREWHRISLLRKLGDLDTSGLNLVAPVIVSQVQNYDARTKLVTTRQHMDPNPLLKYHTHKADKDAIIGVFYGADPGEGLDFYGEFVYAVNINGQGGIRIGDALFTSDASTVGVTISQNNILWHDDPKVQYKTFGPSEDDAVLVSLLDACRYSAKEPIIIQLDALDPQSSYVFQLLTYENDDEMCFDILADDVLIVEHFDPAAIQGGINTHVSGAFLRYKFQTTGTTSVTITLKVSDTPCPVGGSLPVVQAFTLERVASAVQAQATQNASVPLYTQVGYGGIGLGSTPYHAFFVQVTGEGVWCPDGYWYAEYFDNLDLAGAPVAAVCEPTAPNWHWHALDSNGVPSAMPRGGSAKFSARWTSRVQTRDQETNVLFSSLSSGGSRITLDDTTVLDKWEESGTTSVSDLITIGGRGYHVLVYESRSVRDWDTTPTDSYAVLVTSSEDGVSTLVVANQTDTELAISQLYADVGWLVCLPGSGFMNSHPLEAGFLMATPDLTTRIDFSKHFTTIPMVFAGLSSTSALGGHLRLLEATTGHGSLATEYDTCNFVVESKRMLSWIAISTLTETIDLAVSQRPTNASDTNALLQITELLSLPDYLKWHNGTDPCRDRWTGVECRTFSNGIPRVVVLDVRSQDPV